MADAATRISSIAERLLGAPLPITIQAWDGSRAGPPDGPVLIVKSKRAIRRLMWRPDEMGLGRAWVTGEIDLEGDLEEALFKVEPLLRSNGDRPSLTMRDRVAALPTAIRLGAVGRAPEPPSQEAVLTGTRHSKARDRAAISHHYDVGNDFYRIALGPTMVYSCAYWTRAGAPDYGLDDAQNDKLDLICTKLGLTPGMRLLDVGCGWGALVRRAASNFGVRAVGVTLSQEQGEYARKQVAKDGLEDDVEIRVQDWRDVDDGPFDAIASVGMAEHLGAEKWPDYSRRLYGLLSPGGRLLNHQIVRVPSRNPASSATKRRRGFIDTYVFPDGELIPIGAVLGHLEAAGFEVRDVHSLREHYAMTLRAWLRNLDEEWDRAVELAGPERARVWKIYMTGSVLAFDGARIGVDQVLAVRPHDDGRSDLPMTRNFG